MRALPLHYSRPIMVQVLLAYAVPLFFGALCGIVVGASKPGYIALSVLAAIGGLLSGLEHRGALDAASRGLISGALFGAGIVIAHEVMDVTAKVKLPDPVGVLIVVTAVAGAILATPGGAWRERHDRAT